MSARYPAIGQLIALHLGSDPGAARKLAQDLGVSEATVSRWRNLEASPNRRRWPDLAQSLGVPLSLLESEAEGDPGMWDPDEIDARGVAAFAADNHHLGAELGGEMAAEWGLVRSGTGPATRAPSPAVSDLARYLRLGGPKLHVPEHWDLDDHGPLGEFRYLASLISTNVQVAQTTGLVRLEEDWFTTLLQEIHFALARVRTITANGEALRAGDAIVAEQLQMLGILVENALPASYLSDLLAWEVELRERRSTEAGSEVTESDRERWWNELVALLSRPARQRLLAAAEHHALRRGEDVVTAGNDPEGEP